MIPRKGKKVAVHYCEIAPEFTERNAKKPHFPKAKPGTSGMAELMVVYEDGTTGVMEVRTRVSAWVWSPKHKRWLTQVDWVE